MTDGRAPSIRTTAKLIGKSPTTLHRWKTTNPHLYRAAMEYAARHQNHQPAKRGLYYSRPISPIMTP